MAKIRVERKELVEAVTVAAKSADEKVGIMNISKNGGKLVFAGYSPALSIYSNCNFEGDVSDEDISVTVSSKRFKSLVVLLQGETIILDFKGKFLYLYGDNTKLNIPYMDVEFPKREEEEFFVEISAPLLQSQVAACSHALSVKPDEGDFRFKCFCLDVGDDGLSTTATDSLRISVRSELDNASKHIRIVVPGLPLKNFCSVAKGVVSVKIPVSRKFILLETESLKGYLSLADHEAYCNMGWMNGMKFESISSVSTSELLSALEVGNTVDSEYVKIRAEEGGIRVLSNDKNGTYADILLPTKGTSYYSGVDVEAGFNPRFLIDAVRSVPSEELSFQMKDERYPALIKAAYDDSVVEIVLPKKEAVAA